MGKQRRARKKLHLPIESKTERILKPFDNSAQSIEQPILLQPPENLFAGIDINVDGLKSLNRVSEDAISVKSFKSMKSEVSKVLPKKDKLKLRRSMLLKKIDTVNQLKKEAKLRKKRKHISIIGDVNPLHDALPSLQCLVQSKGNEQKTTQIKRKAIEKASKRKKQLVEGVKLLKSVMKNKQFKLDPLKAIAEQVESVVNMVKDKK